MRKASWMALFTIGMLLTAACIADEETHSGTDVGPLPDVTLSVDPLNPESWYPSRWQLSRSLEPMAFSDDWPQAIADFDFQDRSALGRASRLDSLSFLTLAEIGQTRVFLGVNDEGLVGLHFNIFPGALGERQLEVVRMPYLKEKEPDNEVEQVVAGAN